MAFISIVTGASSGLGREISKLLALNGHIVYACARRTKLLNDLKRECMIQPGKIIPMVGDLTKVTVRRKLVKKVLRDHGKIDYLINNAGFGKVGSLDHIEDEDIHGMNDLNVVAVEDMTKMVLPSMKERKSGRIINISSLAAVFPPAYFSVYNGTKAAVSIFSRTLSYELKKSGVYVSVVYPSAMKTEFWEVAFKCKFLTKEQQESCHRKHYFKAKPPMKVARYVVRKLDSRKLILLPGLKAKMGYHIGTKHYCFSNWLLRHIYMPRLKKFLYPKGETKEELEEK